MTLPEGARPNIIRRPINLNDFIISNQKRLNPPVCNALLFGGQENNSSKNLDQHSFHYQIMIVGGPNIRTDFHVNSTEEFFLQLKGEMVLKTINHGKRQDIVIREGQTFLLPSYIPHSPQRLKDTIGLVIEMKRPENVEDQLRWYCSHCHAMVHQKNFICVDLTTQLKSAINDYYSNENDRICKNCGKMDSVPSVDKATLRTAEDIIHHTKTEKEFLQENEVNSLDDMIESDSHPRIDTKTHPFPRNFEEILKSSNDGVLWSEGCQYEIKVLSATIPQKEYGCESVYWVRSGAAELIQCNHRVELQSDDVYVVPQKTKHFLEIKDGTQVIQLVIQRMMNNNVDTL